MSRQVKLRQTVRCISASEFTIWSTQHQKYKIFIAKCRTTHPAGIGPDDYDENDGVGDCGRDDDGDDGDEQKGEEEVGEDDVVEHDI